LNRRKQQLGGLFLLVTGGGFIAWTWFTALTRGYLNVWASYVFPAFFIVGLGLILFPGYREERLARGEDISHVQGYALITTRWWVIIIVALLSAIANNAFLSFL